MSTTESTRPFFSVMPAAVQCSWGYGLLVQGQSVTLGTDPSCGLGLGWMFFLKGDALALLRMGMLLRDVHYDHLARLEGHRTASLQRHGCCATCQIITETVPSVHEAELVVQSLRTTPRCVVTCTWVQPQAFKQ